LTRFYTISINHKTLNLSKLYQYLPTEGQEDTLLESAKKQLGISELMYLNTCNRVCYFMVLQTIPNDDFINQFFGIINDYSNNENFDQPIETLHQLNALQHLFELACSIDSLVIGEREILHQLRTAFDTSQKNNLSGSLTRLVVDHAVLAAKAVFTETKIGEKAVSVVSLAVLQLNKLNLDKEVKILIIGAGQTNILLSKILLQQGYKNFVIANRSIENAERLAKQLNGKAIKLSDLGEANYEFDVLVACTGATQPIVSELLYKKMLNNDPSKKIILDLSIPYNIDPEVILNNHVHYIEIEILRALAEKNKLARANELVHAKVVVAKHLGLFETTLAERMITTKLKHLPEKIKTIKTHAIEKVFDKKIKTLDPDAQKLMHEMLTYMEEKYLNEHFIAAKEMAHLTN
jgi:glutamyl-tRNA reductase